MSSLQQSYEISSVVISHFTCDKTEAQRGCSKVARAGMEPKESHTRWISLHPIASEDLLGQLYRGGCESPLRWWFPGELSLNHVAYSTFLVPRILFSMIWHVGLDLPSYLGRDFPLVRIYCTVTKFLHLQKHIGSCSVVESSNHDQISSDL